MPKTTPTPKTQREYKRKPPEELAVKWTTTFSPDEFKLFKSLGGGPWLKAQLAEVAKTATEPLIV